MSLFNSFRGGPAPSNAQPRPNAQQPNPMQMLQDLRADPSGTLSANTRLQVPTDMQTPEEIQQHLVQSGQVTPAQYQRAVAIARRLMRK